MNNSSSDYCDICKKNIARVHVEGEGNFCLSCYNVESLKKLGREDTYNHSENIYVVEPSGIMHSFMIEHIVLGDIVSWDAYEQNGHYHFRQISYMNESGEAAANRFFKKIVDGVCTKSIEESEVPAVNLHHRDGKVLSLKNKGTINIVPDENNEYRYMFEIDGQIFSPQDLSELLGAFSEFTLQYQIQDKSEPILHEDEYLIPVRITTNSLVDELMQIAAMCSECGDISSNLLPLFEREFRPVLKKLEVLAKCRGKDKALQAGKEMVRILLTLKSDDVDFPEEYLLQIGDIVDPYGLDNELNELIGSFYS